MKRIATWFLSTVTVVVLMFGYHTSTNSTLSATSQPAFVGSSSTGGSTSSTTKSNGGSTGNSNSNTTSSSTVTGDVAQTRWGPVQVELTVQAGSVTEVRVLQYPTGNSTDEQINSYALPVLVQETLDAQSADIDMVSGATVTSQGYVTSLQSALDQAGL
jgi:uncharacterized protein with FMN-binding domain